MELPMKKSNWRTFYAVTAVILLLALHIPLPAQDDHPGRGPTPDTVYEKVREKVLELLKTNDEIPGLSLIIVTANEPVYIKGFGYSDLERKEPVTADTLFELGSCSKAFTALAILKLEADGFLDLDKPVSDYLPWFYVVHKNKKYPITPRQLLHHTSGIPAHTLATIPISSRDDALRQTVRNLTGIELNNIPGKHYEYATINYDILGAIIEAVTGISFEAYMEKSVLGPLGLQDTRVGVDKASPPAAKAVGYKIGFFSPQPYDPPVFRGNNPAAYIITNGKDMARWLELQLGRVESDFYPLIRQSHIPDLSVRPNRGTMTSYGMGWLVNQYENSLVFHSGLNPNYTAYVIVNQRAGMGIALMGNSNSQYLLYIGDTIFDLLSGGEGSDEYIPTNSIDKTSSVISILLGIFLFIVVAFLVSIGVDIIKGRRKYQTFTREKLFNLVAVPLLSTPFLYGLYLIPRAMAGHNWESAFVWGPKSFEIAVVLLLASIGGSYLGYVFSTLFPHQNIYLKSIPMIVLLSILTGGANAVVIFLVTSSLYSGVDLGYLLYYFGLALIIYIAGSKIVRTKLIKITLDTVYDIRIKLIRKIFYTSFQKFEKLDSGRIFATLNNDTGQIGNSVTLFVGLLTSIITMIGAFTYLATIAFWATAIIMSVITVVAILYYIVSQRANRYFNEARDTQNVYMALLRGMIDGFKELSLKYNKKMEYEQDVEQSCDEFRNKSISARIKFVNAFLTGESLLICILGTVGFIVPRLFPKISDFTLITFIMVLLYLIGPINAILGTIPNLLQLRISWNRVKEFQEDIPANLDKKDLETLDREPRSAENLKASGVVFQYKSASEEDDEELFTMGPIDFEAQRGEAVFIVGGNGSGKTTLAKILTGLYISDHGTLAIDGKKLSNYQLGEYFSVVFSDYHLFQKLYNVDLKKKMREANRYLKLLRMEDRVEFLDGSFSTIELSGGQRKRLALMQCFLEDSPIYLFDEVAADQDPDFRRYFYRELLPQMKKQGKIILAITHDDQYFDAADKVIRMDLGKITKVNTGQYYYSSPSPGEVGDYEVGDQQF
jgi:putative ATP-binding cassette transporter